MSDVLFFLLQNLFSILFPTIKGYIIFCKRVIITNQIEIDPLSFNQRIFDAALYCKPVFRDKALALVCKCSNVYCIQYLFLFMHQTAICIQFHIHENFQSNSHPWNTSRDYLCELCMVSRMRPNTPQHKHLIPCYFIFVRELFFSTTKK